MSTATPPAKPAPENPAAPAAPAEPDIPVETSERPSPAPAQPERAQATSAVPEAPETAPTQPEPTEVDELPEWARKHIRELREENKRNRLETKQAAVDEATKAARESFAQDIGRALGLIPDEASPVDEPVTAEKLTEMLAAERASVQDARMQLAVFRAASANEADPSALLDSMAFMATLKDIDPTDQEAVSAAIRSAISTNPRLKAVDPVQATATAPATPPPSGGTFAGGPSGRGNDVDSMSIDDFREKYRKSRSNK